MSVGPTRLLSVGPAHLMSVGPARIALTTGGPPHPAGRR